MWLIFLYSLLIHQIIIELYDFGWILQLQIIFGVVNGNMFCFAKWVPLSKDFGLWYKWVCLQALAWVHRGIHWHRDGPSIYINNICASSLVVMASVAISYAIWNDNQTTSTLVFCWGTTISISTSLSTSVGYLVTTILIQYHSSLGFL